MVFSYSMLGILYASFLVSSLQLNCFIHQLPILVGKDKAKPVVRRGRKATGPRKRIAGLPCYRGSPAFFCAHFPKINGFLACVCLKVPGQYYHNSHEQQ